MRLVFRAASFSLCLVIFGCSQDSKMLQREACGTEYPFLSLPAVRCIDCYLRSIPSLPLQAGIEEGEQKTQNTIKEIEGNGLTLDAEPAEKKEEEKA